MYRNEVLSSSNSSSKEVLQTQFLWKIYIIYNLFILIEKEKCYSSWDYFVLEEFKCLSSIFQLHVHIPGAKKYFATHPQIKASECFSKFSIKIKTY